MKDESPVRRATTRWWARPRFDVIEACLLLVVGAGVTLTAAFFWPGPQLMEPERHLFERQYGPSRHSQNEEEWLIRHFFQDRRGGVFVDVGANHHRDFSNTYYLETELGWSGLAIEPLRQFEEGYRQHRPHTRFLPYFVSDTSDAEVGLYVLEDLPRVASSDEAFTRQWGNDPSEIAVPTITLNDLLEREGVTQIDFLSMDIELAEPQALAGFDIERYRPALVCIEGHPQVRQQLLDYFARHGYVIVGRFLRADTHNLYFKPLE